MLGWLRLARICASRVNRARRSGSSANASGRIFSGSEVDGSVPVALSGRVYCLVDASSGAVHPGDLLTTSNRSGHAMKVTDYEQAQGAILGKAMTGLEQGQGFVLVLVSLQ